MALKEMMIFVPKPDMTAYELAGALGLKIETPQESSHWQDMPEESRRHFVSGLREEEEDAEDREG